MAILKDAIENALNESRILILGVQILIGFQYESIFQKGFGALPVHAQYLKLIGLALMLVAFALLVSPAAYHQIVVRGEDRQELHRFATRTAMIALFPFAISLGIDIEVATEHLSGTTAGLIAGGMMSVVALFFWYGLEILRKSSSDHKRDRENQLMKSQREKLNKQKEPGEGSGTNLSDKIKQVMIESRMVLPGAQALLGFQFIAFLSDGFEKLPASLRFLHLAGLALVTISTILLMTPAAYHRIVERGEDTEHFHRVAGTMVLAAMVPLALGMCGDFVLVIWKVVGSGGIAVAGGVAMLLFSYALWFGYMIYRRSRLSD